MSSTDGQAGGPSRLATWHQELFATILRWPWLTQLTDRVSDAVLPAYDRVRDQPAVELLHGGRWAGHALHPALSDLPIGFWSATVVLDTLGRDESGDGSRLGPAALRAGGGHGVPGLGRGIAGPWRRVLGTRRDGPGCGRGGRQLRPGVP